MKSSPLDRYLHVAERVIALIRPKFYNRLTWVVVIAGLLLMSAPWWSDLLSAGASKYFGLNVPTAEAHYGWGLGLVIAGLVYHLCVHYIAEALGAQRLKEMRAEQVTHDRQTFESFAKAMPESRLRDFLSDLNDNHHFYSEQSRELDAAIERLLAPSSQFIAEELQAQGRQFGRALSELRHWTSLHFFPYGKPLDSGFRFCLHPDLNADRSNRFPTLEESKRYDRFSEDLYSKTAAVDQEYSAFRSEVKRILSL